MTVEAAVRTAPTTTTCPALRGPRASASSLSAPSTTSAATKPGCRAIDHIRSTPAVPDGTWPTGFTYSILDGHEVIGCLYIYPSDTADAAVSSWVTEERNEMDIVTWRAISGWLEQKWPFDTVEYGARAELA